MQIELFSDRLRLRNIRPEDKAHFVMMLTSPEVNQFVRECEPLDVIETKFQQRLAPWRYESGDWLTLVIETLDGEFVGYTGFHMDDELCRRAEVGYLLTPAMQGRGYATEATRAVIDWGALSFNIHKFIACCSEANLGSRKVLERIGFKLEGILRDQTRIKDSWHNDCVYGLLTHERPEVN